MMRYDRYVVSYAETLGIQHTLVEIWDYGISRAPNESWVMMES